MYNYHKHSRRESEDVLAKRTSQVLKPLSNLSTVDTRSLNKKIKDILENENNRSSAGNLYKQSSEESAMTRSSVLIKRQSNVESSLMPLLRT